MRSSSSGNTHNALVLIALAIGFHSVVVHAASCCGGGFAIPSVIVGDEKASLTAEISAATVRTEVAPDGSWHDRKNPESINTLRLQGAHIVLDRFQFGGSLPIVRRMRYDGEATGVGDTALSFGYEYLPDWDYNPYRPKGVGFLSLTLPTGRSNADATDRYFLDVRGRGFWALGLGTILSKTHRAFDGSFTVEAHRSFAKRVENSTMRGELQPGWGSSLGLGLGYNRHLWRFGASLSHLYEDPVRTTGSVESAGSAMQVTAIGFNVSRSIADGWSASLAYADQGLIGQPLGTGLARTVTLALQRRYAR